jgi:hypothetical protein
VAAVWSRIALLGTSRQWIILAGELAQHRDGVGSQQGLAAAGRQAQAQIRGRAEALVPIGRLLFRDLREGAMRADLRGAAGKAGQVVQGGDLGMKGGCQVEKGA